MILEGGCLMESYRRKNKAIAQRKAADLCFDYRCAVSLKKVKRNSKAGVSIGTRQKTGK